jgi:phage gp29-like protein
MVSLVGGAVAAIGRAKTAIERVLFEPSPAQIPRPLALRLQRVGGRLTPEEVSAILRLADTGYMYRLCDLADDARLKDCHLSGILHRRETAVGGLRWQVVPVSDRPKAQRIAVFVEQVLRAFGEEQLPGAELKDLPHTLAHLNGAVFYGYGVAEVLWDRRGRYVVPLGSIPIAPRRFIFAQQDGSFRWWDAVGSAIPYPGVDLRGAYPTGKFLIHRPRINGTVGCMEGLVRPLVWASLFRTWSIGDWMRLAELAWKPYRIGEYERAASKEDKDALLEALELLTTNGFALIPKTTNLKLEYVKGSSAAGNDHATLAAFLAAEMSKCVLGATLTVEQGRVGSNALGNVHADVSKALRDTDARAIEATIQRQLVTPLVRMNFGDNVAVPTFQFITDDAVDLVAYSTAIDRLAGRGLLIPARWCRSTFGIPEPEEGEEVLGGEKDNTPPSTEEPMSGPGAEQGEQELDTLGAAQRTRLEDMGWTPSRRHPGLWGHRQRGVRAVPARVASEIQADLDELRKAPIRMRRAA